LAAPPHTAQGREWAGAGGRRWCEMGSGSFLKVLLSNIDVLAGPLISLAYPLYASVRAIETKNPIDDQQWLTYWVLYSFITLFELTFAPIIEWLPFWSYAKLFFNCWLVLPWFNGAAYVYDHFVRPMFVNRQIVNIWYMPRTERLSKSDDVLSAAERYIQQNGTEAFEGLISKASKSKGKRRSILEEAKAERESWGENPFYDKNYR
jgi:receptor expression-enhancing protein 5/6